uniref:DUF4283 domain-containing protein n=1 Tax=Tanacetum cinerariifolium TaxID=118510 RepID=A0A699IZL4_TANCI|nr:hypothetical protein [Tanacetum cinerariifolium]
MDTSTSSISNLDGILNDATPRVDVAKKVVSVVEETVAKEKLSPVVNTTVFGSNPPLPTHETTLAGNALEDVGTVPVWVKLHCVPVTTFSEDGLSVVATKLGTHLMLDSYTSNMCMQSWGRSSYARAMIELRADVELRDNIVAAMPKTTGERYYTCTCEMKNLNKTSKNLKGFPVGQKMRFKATKQVYQPVSKKPAANTSVNEKKNVDPTKEVRTSNLASQATNSSGSSFWNVDASSPSTTLVIEKINKIEKLTIEGKVTLVDDEAKKDGYGTQSLLKQWMESYENGDYGYDR